MFVAGQPLSAAAAAALAEMWSQYQRYGFALGVTSWPLTVHRAGKGGQIVGIDPAALRPPPDRRYPLGMPCLVTDTYGAVVGIAQRWANADGSVDCEVSGVCADCGEANVPPPPPPPPPPPDPPDDPPESYMVFVSIEECPGFSPSGFPYTVTIADSVEGSQAVDAGGEWFTGVPWGTDTTAVLTYAGGEIVRWAVSSLGCGGPTGFGVGLTATVNGESCENLAVTFTLGGCVPLVPAGLEDVPEPPAPPPPPP